MSTKTKSLIEQTFLELLISQPVSQIEIGDLTTACGISRNTFYYYFKNIPDLVESVVKHFVDDILNNHPPTYDRIEDCFIAAISLAKDNERIVYHICNSTNRAIFERHLWHICDYSVSSFIDSLPPAPYPFTPGEQSILKDFLKFECFGFAIDWINKGMPDDVMLKIEILSTCIKNRLFLLPPPPGASPINQPNFRPKRPI